MKKILSPLVVSALCLSSCSQMEMESVETKTQNQKEEISLGQKAASEIALSAIQGIDKTRSVNLEPEVTYLMRKDKTRSTTQSSDTLAYVFNYPDNGGFAIVANSIDIEPLVAYTDKGHLDCNDQFVQEMILDPLEDFVSGQPLATIDPGIQIGYHVVEEVAPQLIIFMNQHAKPWVNKVQEVQGTPHPVGCVPMAMTYIMTHCRQGQTIKGKYYDFDKIVKTIAIRQGVPGLGLSPYTYDYATAQMSELLWAVGNEIEVNFYDDEYVTGGRTYKAYNKMIEWGYQIPIYNTYPQSELEIKTYLKDNYIVYADGSHTYDHIEYGGHAWVFDGYQDRQRLNNLPGIVFNPITTYLHVKWGESEENDAYFGSIFFTENGADVSTDSFFAVKIEK